LDPWIGEQSLRAAVALLVRIVESAAAIVIFFGALTGFIRFFVSTLRTRGPAMFNPIRLDVSRYLALGLELQLASDLLRTAVTPTFDEIGKMAAVAAIRTALNFFLQREIRAEQADIAGGTDGKRDAARR
jgi:uncharacterized membrane protein